MTRGRPEPDALRERLSRARLMLLFTPAACTRHAPWDALEAALPWVDAVQVRPKSVGSAARAPAPAPARATFEDARRLLDLLAARPALDVLVLADDRVDVARALWSQGLAGVHVGATDMPVEDARAFLGPGPLLGVSTHGPSDFPALLAAPVDYAGFGPVHATGTKGYERGLGAEQAWIASLACPVPMFPIGGVDRTNAHELARIGRAAVGAAILDAEDPGRAARELRAILAGLDS